MQVAEKERALQERILASPQYLPGFDGPVAIADEVPIRHTGGADVVVVNERGEIAIVECKRASNPESRRSVIGQVVEYAAGLWKMSFEDFRRLLEAQGADLVGPFQGVDGWSETAFAEAVARNLEAGEFSLVIAVDEMTSELKKRLERTVALLNFQLPNTQFIAVAWPPDGPVSTYGDQPDAISALRPKLEPDRATLIDELTDPDAALAAESLLAWAESHPALTVEYGRAKTTKILRGVVELANGSRLFRVSEEGTVHVSLSGLRDRGWGRGEIEALIDGLVRIDARFQTKTPRQRPAAPLDALAGAEQRDQFIRLLAPD